MALRSSASGVVSNSPTFTGTVTFPDHSTWTSSGLTLGGPAAAVPVSQTVKVQNVVAGTTDTAGADRFYDGSQGTGTGFSGSHVWRGAPEAGSTGTAQNALVDLMALNAGNNGGPTLDPRATIHVASFYGNTLFLDATIPGSAVPNIGIDGFAEAAAFYWNNGPSAWSSGAQQIVLEGLVTTNAFSVKQGGPDNATPASQTQSVQNVLTGTTDTAGADRFYDGSQGTGTGIGGSHIFRVAPAGTTSSAHNALATALTIGRDIGIGSGSAIATTAVAGFLLIPTCAGAPTGISVNAGPGKAAIIFDTTNSQFWISVSGSSWKQPKTPAGAALVTWQ